MRVEATRKALFESAQSADGHQQGYVGRGLLRSNAALGLAPAVAAALKDSKTPADSASFPLLKVLTGLGMAPSPDSQHMLELEALQISQQSHDIERLLIEFNLLDPKVANDPQIVLSPQVRQVVEALLRASHDLAVAEAAAGQRHADVRARLDTQEDCGRQVRAASGPAAAQQSGHRPRRSRPAEAAPLGVCPRSFAGQRHGLLRPQPGRARGALGEGPEAGPGRRISRGHRHRSARRLRLRPGRSQSSALLAQSGYTPSEGNPQFHQQMVYAVAMTTIGHFETRLGRDALWAPRDRHDETGERTSRYRAAGCASIRTPCARPTPITARTRRRCCSATFRRRRE